MREILKRIDQAERNLHAVQGLLRAAKALSQQTRTDLADRLERYEEEVSVMRITLRGETQLLHEEFGEDG